jgi:RNA polymerase sigma-70 factor, ECF subfamily
MNKMSSETTFFPDTLVRAPASRREGKYASEAESESLEVPRIQRDLAERSSTALSNDAGVSDEQLLAMISGGQKEALAVLFRRHARAVRNVAYRILRDETEADDLLQELFLFLFQKAHLYNAEKSSATSWIIQMTYHRAIDRRRYLEVRHHYDSQELQEEQLLTTDGQVSLNKLAGTVLLNRLRRELSAEQRQTLELHFFEGYSFREIADKTGRTIGIVRNHYSRGVERLRSFVSQEKRV